MKLKFRAGAAAALAVEANDDDLPTVVVVDDEPGNVTALVELLRDQFRVSGFSDANAALAYLRKHPAEVVLTDQRMPGLLGTELLLRLKAEEICPVSVIVTGHTDIQDLVLCINEGLLHRYVLKPWEPGDIINAVRSGVLLSRRREALRRLVPEQALRRIFPEGVEHVTVGRAVPLDCAVLFADLRSFQDVAQLLPPSQAYDLLIQYFELVAPVIARHGGFVDKFLGDGVLAIFDTPARYAEQVVSCAKDIERAVAGFEYPVPGVDLGVPCRVGIGVTGGRVVMGTIGSADRIEITVLGDTVNSAARLEQVSRQLGASTLIEAHLIGDDPPAGYRPLGPIHVRNRRGAVSVGEIAGTDAVWLAPPEALRPALAALASCDLERAIALLCQVSARWPEDLVLKRLPDFWRPAVLNLLPKM